MRILVTGGTGFIGSFATRGPDRGGPRGAPPGPGPGEGDPGVRAPPGRARPRSCKGDITDAASVDAALAGVRGCCTPPRWWPSAGAAPRRSWPPTPPAPATSSAAPSRGPEPHRAHLVGQRPVLARPPPGHARHAGGHPDSAYGKSKAEAELLRARAAGRGGAGHDPLPGRRPRAPRRRTSGRGPRPSSPTTGRARRSSDRGLVHRRRA